MPRHISANLLPANNAPADCAANAQPPQPPQSPPYLTLEEIREHDNSIAAIIRVVPATLRIDETLAAAALALRPTLAQHACKQRGFGLFADKILGTTLPHLVEHIAIDLLVAELSAPRAGTTVWLNRKQGLMEVKLSLIPHKEPLHNTNSAPTPIPGIPPATPSSPSSPAENDAKLARMAIIRAITLVNSLLAH